MPATVRFNRALLTPKVKPPAKVYLRANWADPWVQVPYLWSDGIVQSVVPAMSTATLHWRFGRGIQYDKTFAVWYNRLTGREKHYAKIVYESHAIERDFVPQTTAITWAGTLEQDIPQLGGSREYMNPDGSTVLKESGTQTIVGYGLEHILHRVPIDRTYWHTADGTLRTAARTMIFNAPDVEGRALGNLNLLFHPQLSFEQTALSENTVLWSTRYIVQYLVQHFQPRNSAGDVVIPVTLSDADAAILPNADKPVFDPTGLSLWECLGNLIARTRMLGCYLQFVEGAGGAPDSIALKPYSLVPAALECGEITIPANGNQVNIEFERDNDIRAASVKQSSVQAVDQFVLRGARRTSTCSLSKLDATLNFGWKPAHETEYNTGGSDAIAYAGMGTNLQQQLNNEVRAAEKLRDVYRWFVHNGELWNQQAGNGEGGEQQPVFPDDANVANAYLVNPRELFLLPCLMLQEGKNYEDLGSLTDPTPPVLDSVNARNRQPPLVFMHVPAAASPDRYWVEGTKIAENAHLEATSDIDNRLFSLRVEVPNLAYGLYWHVEGQKQHVIAYDDFVPLDVDTLVGQFDWREAICTVSLEDDRHCEGRWPPDNLLFLAGVDRPRRQILYVGDHYRQDYLVPNTVVRVNAKTGALVRSTGGWIADDRQKLIDRAQQIYRYFGQVRRSLTFETGRHTSALRRGEYVVQIGVDNITAIGSVITQISISSPEGENAIPRMLVETSYLELEAVQS